jgi:hypothetical protein
LRIVEQILCDLAFSCSISRLPNRISISSILLPFVSGNRKYPHNTISKLKPPARYAVLPFKFAAVGLSRYGATACETVLKAWYVIYVIPRVYYQWCES